MKNRRNLKKYIRLISGALAASVMETYYEYNCIPHSEINDLLLEIARLQQTTLSKLSVTFDKTPSSENPETYRKERKAYYKKAIAALMNEFETKVAEIIKKINSKIPTEVRDSLKQRAEK